MLIHYEIYRKKKCLLTGAFRNRFEDVRRELIRIDNILKDEMVFDIKFMEDGETYYTLNFKRLIEGTKMDYEKFAFHLFYEACSWWGREP